MTAERWKRIEDIYHSAMECSPVQRVAYISEACQGDEDLRKEIEELVWREESPAGKLLERSAWRSQTGPVVPITAGSRLGPYEIAAAIGAGGMGVVFRAVDTRLGRSVAIKTSHGPFSGRFAREARTIASLNHPNICTLYDVGPDYLVMEMVEGATLADRIRKGPLALGEALPIARQIAGALEAAHEQGIVHRDLKPANIKVRPDGSVKVLDFGLAKSRAESEAGPDSVEIKLRGLIIGTAAYMSPEQALGNEVDKRADIWAFGATLYEMLTGAVPFHGTTVSDCLAAIVQKEPDLSKVPVGVRRLLGRCLEKDPKKRLRDLGDWEHLLDGDESPRTSSGLRAPRKVAWLAMAAILIALSLWALRLGPAVPASTTRFQVNLPENAAFGSSVIVSPDGQKLVFNDVGAQSGLWLHDLKTLDWRRLPGTEEGRSPFWSPDSRFLGFAVRDRIQKVAVAGGPSVPITAEQTSPGSGTWSQDGVIVFGGYAAGALRRVSSDGGPATDLTAVDGARGETFHGIPTFLPDGKHFLYFIGGSNGVMGIYAGSINVPTAAQPRVRLLATPVAARYVDGKLLFLRDGALMAQPFDAARLRLTGEPIPVVEQVQSILSTAVFSASPGVLAYRSAANKDGAVLTWFDRQGKEVGTFGQPSLDTEPRLSPNGMLAAVRDNSANLWLLDFARGLHTRFTFRPPASGPVWSPDGSRIYFSAGATLQTIFEKAANGTGPEKEWLTEPGVYHYSTSISPDGRFLLYFAMPRPAGPGVKGQTWVLPLQAGRRPIHLLGTEFSENRAVFSPDGRWIAYRSNESGRFELYVRAVRLAGSAGPSLGEGKWQISKEGVAPTLPVWRHDGKELFFMSERKMITAVDTDGRRDFFQAGNSKPLFTIPCGCEWDASGDGQRFFVHGANAAGGGKAPVTVVLNWQSDLKWR
jgi:serine/threonine protein kinase/Tol biopolymer transport system component